MSHACFPVSLLLDNRPCLVVGGGRVAARKIAALLEAGARVTVVAPELAPSLLSLEQEQKITCCRRGFIPADLNGMLLVIAATDDALVQQQVFQAAEEKNILVNVADVPSRCSFFMPAVVRRGPVSVAVSTGGASPALAAHIRRELEKMIGPQYGFAAELLGKLRPVVLQESADCDRNHRLFAGLLACGLVEKIAGNQWEQVREMAVAAAGEEAAVIVAALSQETAERKSG